MNDKFQYRLSKNQKDEIAQNLIDILQKGSEIIGLTRGFIIEWCCTDASGKGKALFDVWDIVLKNYLPTTRPFLFRACERLSKNGKIASFTGRLECARRFSDGKGSLIICDTKENLKIDEHRSPGQYRYSFYPLVNVLEKAKASGGCGFTERFLDEFMGEDEYIMRIDLGNMHCFKWIKSDR
ncbi:hypothetical protein [Dysgonomonas sp. BGC7]|uniref:hypothetical protein n=1 Tax=Dysgonomonas sp. BGC7 TaxID=1658008 RepID=UPI000A88AD7D|nr:hypothetical protein [Dysgonomonas sp. BGC7]MBD8388369.1 hypothetical protein [Dysgonomonas sp. BGC7]